MIELLTALVILVVVHGVGSYWTLANKRVRQIECEEE